MTILYTKMLKCKTFQLSRMQMA